MSTETKQPSRHHHYVPQFHLRRFCDADGLLTVVHASPAPKVERNRHPRKVGRVEGLNSVELKDGTVSDKLERFPLGRLDSAGAQGLAELIAYTDAVEPPGQLRLWNRPWEERVPLTLHVGGLMVRGPLFRAALDDRALPALLEYMRAGLKRELKAGRASGQAARPIFQALDTPGMVKLDPSPNRHQHALVDLITSATAAIGETHLISVRRLQDPLITGSDPVVLFPDGDLTHGRSLAQLMADTDPPIVLWEERDELLKRLSDLVKSCAGLAWAADRYTAVVHLNPDTADGGRLMVMSSEISSGGLAGLLNLKTIAASDWVAGPAGDGFLEMLARASAGSAQGS